MSFYGPRLLDTGVGSHVVSHPDIAANHGVVADSDTSKDAGVTVDGDIVLDDGMTRYVEHIAIAVFFKALGTQRHTLIERHVVSDNRRFANNHACTMINGKVGTCSSCNLWAIR